MIKIKVEEEELTRIDKYLQDNNIKKTTKK